MTRFLHTADWQLGKPFAGVEDPHKRALLQNERVEVLRRIGDVAREHQARFLVVAGDLFDSPQPAPSIVAAGCAAIGRLGLPVFAIPGNHDHVGGGTVWEQEFFRRQAAELAPNLTVLLERNAVPAPGALLFPCPLLQRHDSLDPTAWLRPDACEGQNDSDPLLPRVVVAHGSIRQFGAFADDEDAGGDSANLLDLTRLPAGAFDYIALGDWHGTLQVTERAWYSGTPEHDRFLKGGGHDPGHVLVVEAERGRLPSVRKVPTSGIRWSEVEWEFTDDAGLDLFFDHVAERIGHRVNEDVLRLHLRGALGFEAMSSLETALESWTARTIRLRLETEIQLSPSPGELQALTARAGDPLVARVAARLTRLAAEAGDPGEVAQQALRQLHLACQSR